MSLTKLPLEILLGIIEQIPSKRDVSYLGQSSRNFLALTRVKLFESIHINVGDRLGGDYVDAISLPSTLGKPDSPLRHVKHLSFTAPFHTRLLDRCPHKRGYAGTDIYKDLIAHILSFMTHLKADSLLSFHWDLGTCIPDSVLGISGYLSLSQRCLESISLVTNGRCRRDEIKKHLDPSTMKRLRSISWKGFQSAYDFYDLGSVLKTNSQNLIGLQLEAIKWDEAENEHRLLWERFMDIPEPQNFFAEVVLKLNSDQQITFQSLETLSLREISFCSYAKLMAASFHIGRLRELKLLKCPKSLTFLKALVDSGQFIKLTSFELLLTHTENSELLDIEETMSSFLGCFQGLEVLHLCILHMGNYPLSLWDSIYHHGHTLRRLCYHEAGYMRNMDNNMLELQGDIPPVIQELPSSLAPNFFLESVSLSSESLFLETDINRLGIVNTIKLLQLRQLCTDVNAMQRSNMPMLVENLDTGSFERLSSNHFRRRRARYLPERILNFAAWAFGPEGLPSLLILAYGDFSYKSRYETNDVLFCRNPIYPSVKDTEPYIFTTIEKYNKWDGVDGGYEILLACPIEGLLL